MLLTILILILIAQLAVLYLYEKNVPNSFHNNLMNKKLAANKPVQPVNKILVKSPGHGNI